MRWTALALLQFGNPPAHAQESAGARDEFTFRTAAGCPDRSAFVASVGSRFAREPGGAVVERLNRLLEGVEISDSGRLATIRFRDASAERIVRGNDCAEVTAAATLIAAMALGYKPRAKTDEAGANAAGGDAAPTGAAAGDPADSHAAAAAGGDAAADATVAAGPPFAGLTDLPASSPLPSVPRVAATPTPTPPLRHRRLRVSALPATGASVTRDSGAPLTSRPGRDSASDASRTWRLSLGGSAGGNTLTGPHIAPEFGLSAIFGAGPWSLSAGAGYSRSYAETADDERRANLALWVGRALGCAALFGDRVSWQLGSCAFFEAGVLKARGDASSPLSVARSAREPWFAVGVGGGLASPAFHRTHLHLDLGATLPVLRQTFALEEPAAELYQVPVVGLFGRLGVTVELGAL